MEWLFQRSLFLRTLCENKEEFQTPSLSHNQIVQTIYFSYIYPLYPVDITHRINLSYNSYLPTFGRGRGASLGMPHNYLFRIFVYPCKHFEARVS
jgi:hypothetical protein